MGSLTIAAGAAPVPLAEVKALLRIATSDEDALLAGFVRAAADLCERFTGRLLVARDVTEIVPRERGWRRLAAAPVRAIGALAALAPDGGTRPLDAGDYAIDIDAAGAGWVRIHAWPDEGRVSVPYVAGLAETAGALPEALRHGVARLAAHLYLQREAGADAAPPAAITALWRPWRRLRIG